MKRSALWTMVLISLACLVFASLFSQISAQTSSSEKGEKKEATQEEESKKRFPWDNGPATIDVSKYPKEQQDNYKVFAQKCAKCHTLARAISAPYALPKEWETYIKKMKKKRRSGLDSKSAKATLNFLIYDSSAREKYWLEPPPPPDAGRVERGKWLFRQKGCFTCHGPEGQGGVQNFNYVKDTVPTLNTLAEEMMLFEKEDAQKIVEYLERGIRLESLEQQPPVPQFNVVLAKHNSIRDVIQKGNPAGKKDPQGPRPPLNMLAWSERLSEADIDALIAYLLTLYPWEEE